MLYNIYTYEISYSMFCFWKVRASMFIRFVHTFKNYISISDMIRIDMEKYLWPMIRYDSYTVGL